MAQHTCTGCVPIDAKIIDVYIQMISATARAETAAEHAEEVSVGKSPYIGENGDWWEWSEEQDAFVDTGVQAHGSIAVDTHLDPNSTNPVQNKVTTQALVGKQDTLVSGQNVKTVNGESILGPGNIIAGDPNAVKYVEQTLTDSQKTQARSNIGAGTYSKAGSGIPKSDLSSAVQTSLGKADTAIQDISGKQDTISDLSTIRSGAAAGATAYQKPASGVPASDMASGVQTSLGKADTAYQKPGSGVPKTDLESGVQASLDLADSAIQARPMGEIDPTITPADYATKEELDELEAEVLELSTPRSVKNALYSILQNVAFINNNGYSTELAQIRAWAENLVLMSISATFTQGTAEIYDTDSLDKLKRYLVVTATYDDSSTVVLNDSDYSLSGTLAIGTSTITVTYQGKTDTFSVVVTASPYLYILQSPFTSSGSNSIDTGFRPEKGKTYTILCESQESTSSSTPVFIFGNRLTTSSGYQGWTSQNGRVWGLSLPNGNQINVGSNTLRVASVFTASADDGAMVGITLRYRIGSGAITQRDSEHYGPDMTVVSSTSNFFLGAQYYGSQGFLGVINSFVIFDGEMPLADITDFLNNGM